MTFPKCTLHILPMLSKPSSACFKDPNKASLLKSLPSTWEFFPAGPQMVGSQPPVPTRTLGLLGTSLHSPQGLTSGCPRACWPLTLSSHQSPTSPPRGQYSKALRHHPLVPRHSSHIVNSYPWGLPWQSGKQFPCQKIKRDRK